MAVQLTVQAVENLRPRNTRREEPDGKIGGLFLIVQPSGAKSWALRYRIQGIPRKYTLGQYPGMGLADARRQALLALGEIAKEGDPAARKRAERATAKAARAEIDDLVENVVMDFVNIYAKRKTRDWIETERLLTKNVVPAWRGRKLGDIEKKHVAKLLDDIVDRGAPIGANRVFAQLRKMCSWAVARGIIVRNPCEGMSRPSPEVERERVLMDDELALVWRAAGERAARVDLSDDSAADPAPSKRFRTQRPCKWSQQFSTAYHIRFGNVTLRFLQARRRWWGANPLQWIA